MSDDRQLRALHLAGEIAEQEARQELMRIEGFYQARLSVLEKLDSRIREIGSFLRNIHENDLVSALSSANSAQIGELKGFSRRLTHELEQLTKSRIDRERDLKLASERMEEARENLLASQIQQRQAGELKERGRREAIVLREASESIHADELSSRKKREE